jgi:ubiquinone/menaquinone biosynthesis C-methylase UbiE
MYKLLSIFYDLFDLIFLFGKKGNPRKGLLDAIPDTSLRILDVCVGTAASSLLVASAHPRNQIQGIDISDAMLAVARRKITRNKVGNLKVVHMSATAMQFPKDSFDVVMISFALHEFEKDLREKIFREIEQVIVPGGTFLVLDFARQGGQLNKLFLDLWTFLEPSCFVDYLEMDWLLQLNSFGFSLEKVQEFSFSNLNILHKNF